MAQIPLPIGGIGEITISATTDGKIRARCYYRNLTGERVRVEARGKTETAAKRNLKARIAEKNKALSTSKDTFATIATKWLEHTKNTKNLRPRSLEIYGKSTAIINAHIGTIRLDTITKAHVITALDEIYAHTPGTYRNVLSVTNQIFKYAATRGIIESSPLAFYEPLPAKKFEVTAFTLPELRHVQELATAYQHRPDTTFPLGDVVELMTATAARPGETLATALADVDLTQGTVRVENTTVVDDQGRTIVQEGGKEHKKLEMQLPASTLNMLRRRLSDAKPGQVWLFPRNDGQPPAHSSLTQAWRLAIKPHYPQSSPKIIRKSIATLTANADSLDAAAQALGHSNSEVTAKHYVVRDDVVRVDITHVTSHISGTTPPDKNP